MTFEGWLDGRMVQALGWTLLHFLWQGAVAAVLLAIAGGLVARRSPNARYALGVATLALMAALPLLTFLTLMQAAGGGAQAPTEALATVAGTALLPAFVRDAEAANGGLAPVLRMLVGLWALGVAILSVRVAGGWTVAQRRARSGRPVGSAYLESALARDAGTVTLEGRFQDGAGAGHFTFAPSAEFVSAMRQGGYGRLDTEKVFAPPSTT